MIVINIMIINVTVAFITITKTIYDCKLNIHTYINAAVHKTRGSIDVLYDVALKFSSLILILTF